MIGLLIVEGTRMARTGETWEHPLSGRYASDEMLELWSELVTAQLWRRLWLVLAEGAIARTPTGGFYAFPPTPRLHRTCVAAGVRRIGWHVLRHTFATWLLLAGATLYQVSRLLGHSSVRVTESAYAHVAARDLDGVLRLL